MATTTGPVLWAEYRHELNDQLAAIQKEGYNGLHQAIRAVGVCHAALSRLCGSISHYDFPSPEERITCFKETEPYFRSRLIYFNRLFWLESGRPPGDRTTIEDYLRREWRFIQDFHDEHHFLQRYLRSGATWLDDKLFTQPPSASVTEAFDPGSADPLHYDAPHIIAHLQAHDLMQDYLISATEELKQPGDRNFRNMPMLMWTDSKAALIELGYALQSAGSLNDGKAELKEIMECLQTVFHVDLGHYHRTFQEILSRKSGYTNYIKKLENKLLLRIKLIEDRHDPN